MSRHELGSIRGEARSGIGTASKIASHHRTELKTVAILPHFQDSSVRGRKHRRWVPLAPEARPTQRGALVEHDAVPAREDLKDERPPITATVVARHSAEINGRA
jgi:hypothetical protein